MTPKMAKRVEFLREATARGYGVRWMAGELGIAPSWINAICREHGIKVTNRGGVNKLQGRKRSGTADKINNFGSMPNEDIYSCEDFLPDVGDV